VPVSICPSDPCFQGTYSLGDVIYNHGAVGVPVVHGCERLVALLACRVPDLKLDGCGFVEGDGLGQERSADGGFSVVVELVLSKSAAVRLGVGLVGTDLHKA
jgi:hypothetical protein